MLSGRWRSVRKILEYLHVTWQIFPKSHPINHSCQPAIHHGPICLAAKRLCVELKKQILVKYRTHLSWQSHSNYRLLCLRILFLFLLFWEACWNNIFKKTSTVFTNYLSSYCLRSLFHFVPYYVILQTNWYAPYLLHEVIETSGCVTWELSKATSISIKLICCLL